MRHPIAVVLPVLACLPLAAEEPMLAGISLGYTQLLSGQIEVDGEKGDWDSGGRFELILRDYYFQQSSHHPFAEVGLLLENHEASNGRVKIDTETIAISFGIGSAIPVWRQPDRSMAFGFSPHLGFNLGRLDLDVRYTETGTKSSDDTFRWGLVGGIDAWLLINRSFSVTLGVLGSYWRANEIHVDAPNGLGGTEQHSSSPTGWDVGVRATAGFTF